MGGGGGGTERERGRDSSNVTTANGEKGTLETISVVAVDMTHIKSSSSVNPVSKGIPATTTTALTISSSITMVSYHYHSFFKVSWSTSSRQLTEQYS